MINKSYPKYILSNFHISIKTSFEREKSYSFLFSSMLWLRENMINIVCKILKKFTHSHHQVEKSGICRLSVVHLLS